MGSEIVFTPGQLLKQSVLHSRTSLSLLLDLFLLAMLGHSRRAGIFSYAEALTEMYLVYMTSFSSNTDFIRPQTCLFFSVLDMLEVNF